MSGVVIGSDGDEKNLGSGETGPKLIRVTPSRE